jgi:hypothetical protein
VPKPERRRGRTKRFRRPETLVLNRNDGSVWVLFDYRILHLDAAGTMLPAAASYVVMSISTITLWCAFITVIFVLPPNELVLWTMLAVALWLAGYWRVARFCRSTHSCGRCA